jgi:anti-anti-sigma factor
MTPEANRKSARDDALGEPFQTRLERLGEIVLVRLSGALGGECEERFRTEVMSMSASEASRLVLDLRGLTFIDSTGLRAIIQCDAWARGQELDFAVIRGTGQVRRLFELTGLEKTLAMLEDDSQLTGAR